MTTSCKDVEDRFEVIANHYIEPAISLIIAIIMVILIVIYIKQFVQEPTKLTKTFFYIGLIFFFTIFAAYICLIMVGLLTCTKYYNLYIIFQNGTTQLYVAQTIMLLGILYHRLYFVFHKTCHKLSLLTTRIFVICYLFTSISFIFAGYMYANYMNTIGPSIIALVSLLVIFMIIFLISLFIYKLLKVYKSNEQNAVIKQNLLNVITKHSLLTFISTFNVILSAISSGLRPVFNSVYWDFFFTVIINIDMFSNFFCIYLSYQYFDPWYKKICSCCHSKCMTFWNICVGNGDAAMQMEMEIEAQMKDMSQKSTNMISVGTTSHSSIAIP